jgi:anti-anti-sigma regulatory factor
VRGAPVSLTVEQQGEVVIAHLSGELDLAGAPRAGEEIGEAVPAEARGLVVDF